MHVQTNPLHVKIADGIWAGNVGASKDSKFLLESGIKFAINLSGRPYELAEDADYFEFALPNHELMASEMPKTIHKLDSIMAELKAKNVFSGNTLVYCLDGKNRSMLLIGYYLVVHRGRKADEVITLLEQAYFTQQQKITEQDSRGNSAPVTDVGEGSAIKVDPALEDARDKRNLIRCLTNASFKKLLRGKSSR